MKPVEFFTLIFACWSAIAESKTEADSEGNSEADPQWQGEGFYPGNENTGGAGNGNYNPGWNNGNSGFNPGNGGNGNNFITPVYNPDYNPDISIDSSGDLYNPGTSGYNPGTSGYNPGASGFNPGTNGYNPGNAGYNPGASGYNPGNFNQGFFPGASGGECASEQCCGMADQNCCLGGKQCYTYYEQECKRVDRPRCQIESSEFCKPREIPMCRVIRTPQQAFVNVESCMKKPKRECFKYEREICNTYPESYLHNVTWQNEKLDEAEKEEVKDCKTMDACKMVPEIKEEERVIEKQVCNKTRTEQKEQCTVEYQRGAEQVMQRTEFKVDYRQLCYNVPRQICESNSCTTQGCLNGGAVCSSNDYTYQQRCATVVGGQLMQQGPCGGGPQFGSRPSSACGSQSGRFCQNVTEAACYGPSLSCQSPSQQCCQIIQQKVCKQVPIRVPMMVNFTIPGRMIPERKCETVSVEVPYCETIQETIKENKTYERCEMTEKEHCVTFELPSYNVVKLNRTEQVDLRVTRCKKSTLEQEYCHTFPDATVECRERREARRYILNKVVCDRKRSINICRTIPWSRCTAGSDQECRMVPRQRCVDSCSTSPDCMKCDQLRQQGALQGSCPNQIPQMPGPVPAMTPPAATTCGNFYPQDLIGGVPAPAYSSNAPTYPTASSYPSDGGDFQLPKVFSQPAQITSQNFIPDDPLVPNSMQSDSLPEIGDISI